MDKARLLDMAETFRELADRNKKKTWDTRNSDGSFSRIISAQRLFSAAARPEYDYRFAERLLRRRVSPPTGQPGPSPCRY
jgi:hypothetical protein